MSNLKVLVIEEFENGQLIENTLRQSGFDVASLKLKNLDLPEMVRTLKPDVAILSLYSPNQTVLSMIRDTNRQHSVPVVIFAEDQKTETINEVIKAGVSAYIVAGLEPKRLKTIVEIAIARFNENQELKRELQKTKTQLEDRKLIDRAKAILIKSQGYTEEQAYHALRKLAMDRTISVGDMAKNVIAMAELLK